MANLSTRRTACSVNSDDILALRPRGEAGGGAFVDGAKLLARNARLEAALRDCKRYAEDYNDGSIPQRVDAALKDAPKCYWT